MLFRFSSAILLAVAVSLIGIALEKESLKLKRLVSRQHYQLDVLVNAHAKMKLATQRAGSPRQVLNSIERGELDVESNQQPALSNRREMPLLQWHLNPHKRQAEK
ncbi:MAG: hypothetical protein CME31_02380 [Gimesia sp.]|jgi:hypothetical protein|uniref:Cell division protein FtsL n=1 Tax=Gimesia maris TaxID=122 RepID=A0A3D3RD42_9PLAN|nr:hypothetical protein [Gimesia sp.]HCO25530.1 hypothetical protein [Gimesia maris]|tara:strand:+ start:68319 stop:68633 length:315 start_codon:yes stop_codon:yes gene_type:complete